ncbi:MAG: hypothetical protein HC905_04705 [Bacteroidales bacterium]|nr:hypothetical protein [Bacteroidales bacterium]
MLDGSYFIGQGIGSKEFRNDPAFHGFGWSNNRERLQAIYTTDESFKTFIDRICETINVNSHKLNELLLAQHYMLTHWQKVDDQLNYRRFFTINGLISLAMEKDAVFEGYHTLIENLVKNNTFNGLRIDHVDGLKDPGLYFDKLRARTGENTYIIVEKNS